MNAVQAMPTHLTTLRGKGGWGSTQKMADMFWVMTSSASGSKHISTLLHTYIALKTAVTDVNMKVSYGFPLNTFAEKAQTGKATGNDGSMALATGLKIFISKDDTPLEDYYGFFVLKMTPFFKATGGNEIDAVVSGDSTRTVQCWYHGSTNGQGWCVLSTAVKWIEYYTGKYYSPHQYGQMPLVICKLGKVKGTATHGDVIVIPATTM